MSKEEIQSNQELTEKYYKFIETVTFNVSTTNFDHVFNDFDESKLTDEKKKEHEKVKKSNSCIQTNIILIFNLIFYSI